MEDGIGIWRVNPFASATRTIQVKHANGLSDLVVLLGRAGPAVEALELYAGPDAPRPSAADPVVDRKAPAA